MGEGPREAGGRGGGQTASAAAPPREAVGEGGLWWRVRGGRGSGRGLASAAPPRPAWPLAHPSASSTRSLSSNDLSGTVPTEFGFMNKLQALCATLALDRSSTHCRPAV